MTGFNRRRLLTSLTAGLGGLSVSGWFPAFAAELAAKRQKSKHCILLWMSGGPSQTDTWDLKPNHENGGEFKEIATASTGLRISEHLPKLATMSEDLAVLRGLSTGEGDHGRGTYLMRTGHAPGGFVRHPCVGSSLSSLMNDSEAGLPKFVSIGAYRAFNQDAFSPGFLGPRHGPLFVAASDMQSATADADGYPQLEVRGMRPPQDVTAARMNHRLQLWKQMQSRFLAKHQTGAPKAHNTVYENAVRLMNSKDAAAFDLSLETDATRERYGPSVFGQGCLLARRLVERGVSFVEVSLGTSSNTVGWDTHTDNFNAVRELSEQLDQGWSSLLAELKERGLLESTTILWMGEFGRTPRINNSTGRDHFPAAWSAVLAGGGIAGGQAFGRTSVDGMRVEDGQVSAEDLLATLAAATGVGADANLINEDGRPIPIAEGKPIREVLA